MALRVLLADESTTIKKVMQLALQDFAVEVKAVHVGVDVVEVAKSFEPDIIFVDVLLQKRNGYEVSAEIKREHRLSDIPVVLMWSSFMDLDEGQAEQSGADRRLEKPFDVENLRQIVLELVPKTRSQRLAHFLKFPDSFAEPMRKEEKVKEKQAERPAEQRAQPEPVRATPPPTAAAPSARSAQQTPSAPPAAAKTPARDSDATKPPPLPPREEPKPFRGLKPQDKIEQEKPQRRETENEPAASANWNMESFDDIGRFHEEAEANPSLDDDANEDEGFEQFRITPPARTTAKPMGRSATKSPIDREEEEPANEPAATDDRDPWSHQDLSRFKLDLPPVSVENEDIEIDLDIPERDQPSKDFLMRKPAGVQKNPAKPASRDEGTKTGFTNKMQRPPLALDDYSSINAKPVPSARNERNDDADDFGQEVDLEFDTEERSKKPQLRRSIDDDIPSFGADDLPPASLELEPEDLEDEASVPVDTDYRRSAKPMADASMSRDPRSSGTQSSAKRRAPVPDLGDDDADDLATGGAVPQLSPERLEEIIRAQSREIIEAVVRRVVPDLATDMIREELQRLLEDTGGGSRGDARRDRQR